VRTTAQIELEQGRLLLDRLERRLVRMTAAKDSASEDDMDQAQYEVDNQRLEVEKLVHVEEPKCPSTSL